MGHTTKGILTIILKMGRELKMVKIIFTQGNLKKTKRMDKEKYFIQIQKKNIKEHL